DGRDHRWYALRRNYSGKGRRLATAQRKRARRSPLPGAARRRDRRQTGARCVRARCRLQCERNAIEIRGGRAVSVNERKSDIEAHLAEARPDDGVWPFCDNCFTYFL